MWYSWRRPGGQTIDHPAQLGDHLVNIMISDKKKYNLASDETAAHDLLIVLLEREGSTIVLRLSLIHISEPTRPY